MKTRISRIRLIFFGALLTALLVSNHAAFAFSLDFKINGKKYDLLKKSDKKKEGKKEKASGSKKSSKKSAKNSAITRVAGKGPTGPDVVGLRIGGSPADVRRLFKKRGMKVEEFFGDLRPGKPYGSGPPIFGEEKFLMRLIGHGAGRHDNFDVFFTPSRKGNERIKWLERKVRYYRTSPPTFGAFKRSLVEKYGTPTYKRDNYPGHFFWVYDSKGNLQKPGLITERYYQKCRVDTRTTRIGGMIRFHIDAIQNASNFIPALCGSVNLEIMTTSPHFSGISENQLVKEFLIRLSGIDEHFGSAISTKLMVNRVLEKRARESVERGKKIKTDL